MSPLDDASSSMTGLRFHILNLGCKVNRVESDSFAAGLQKAGGLAVPLPQADVVVVNTCTVTGEAEKKTRKAVRRALRANSLAQVVVTGCAVAIDPGFYQDLSPRVRVVPKGMMAAYISGLDVSKPDVSAPGISDPDASAFAMISSDRVGEGFRTRVGVKVQDGCDNACTYCIVHIARGPAVSRPHQEICDEVSALAAQGVKEVVLTGINLGSYRDGSLTFAGLVEMLLDLMPPTTRIRVGSVEPGDVDQDLIRLFATRWPQLCRHMHLPLQSGSDGILAQMNRPYSAAAFLALVESLYEQVPAMSLTTDVIVGFPGETSQDFQQTLEACRQCRFSKIHVFPYSKREGTPAALRSDQVDDQVKASRCAQLEELSAQLRAADLAARRGSTELVLVEDGGQATTESYHSVAAPPGACNGDLVPVVL
ncbi:MAG: tRNA (N(6)-L-threonylcarbamoyladenosine(37)-C(2))-methylthiotransferase MtaB [Eggerthellales bacterium]|nr:tRNA (N(6)-L-threonylcarbamoyladenosine(37)-C(2))-methylthiotransferase MtaB [Eggerthellales bacterium]